MKFAERRGLAAHKWHVFDAEFAEPADDILRVIGPSRSRRSIGLSGVMALALIRMLLAPTVAFAPMLFPIHVVPAAGTLMIVAVVISMMRSAFGRRRQAGERCSA